MSVHFLGVRHHSPAAARHAGELIRRLRPAKVLIEGPWDFNPRIDELRLPHRPPVAIYTWVALPDGTRLGGCYPLCVYSPEWQAIRASFETGAELRFIDLPWADLADPSAALHRYADGELRRNPYVEKLCAELAVDGFDEAWDRLFEVDPDLDADAWTERCHLLCRFMREAGEVAARDRLRERFMACRIRDAVAEGGEVVVLTGGFHTSALRRLVEEGCEDVSLKPERQGEGRGICLMPYSYRVLDGLRGYDAGMPNPGFYHRVWEDRQAGLRDPWRGLLADVAHALRQRKQLVSAADLIAVETTARALAAIRGHAEVWRLDLLDGITGALVKDEIDPAALHPLLAACHDALRGDAIGELAEGTPLPALVLEVKERLAALDLTPTATGRRVRLDLHAPEDMDRAMLLHALQVLGVPGFRLDRAPAGVGEVAEERWTVGWTPGFEGRLVEASAYGATLVEACASRLLERAREVDRDALAAARLLRDACLAGIESVHGMLSARVAKLVQDDDDFTRVAAAAAEMLALFRYDPLLRAIGRDDVGQLLRDTWIRALALMMRLGVPPEPGPAVAGLAATVEVFERCELSLDLARDGLTTALERVAGDRVQLGMVRGAALGALWVLGARDGGQVDGSVGSFASPEELGDFLAGLFRTARELARRHPELLRQVDAALSGWVDDQFLEALPGMRLAFSAFTPREKHHLARALFESGEAPDLRVDAGAAARMLAFEAELFARVRRFGLRGER